MDNHSTQSIIVEQRQPDGSLIVPNALHVSRRLRGRALSLSEGRRGGTR